MRRTPLVPVLLALLAAGCGDRPLPTDVEDPQFANGPKGTRTVTSLEDPGDGACTPDHCTLREAIAAAQPGDRIVFKKGLAGTIALTAGELFIETDLVIDGGGVITIVADEGSRVATTSAEVTLAGLTLTGGHPTGTVIPVSSGGAVLNFGTLTLESVTLVGNTGSLGGGIHNGFGATLNILRSTITENAATWHGWGGGIYNMGTMRVVLSTISANTATGENPDDGVGGGVYNQGTGSLVVSGSTFAINEAVRGGGIFNEGSLTLGTSMLLENSAQIYGGGLVNLGSGTVLLTTFSQNFAPGLANAGYGGAISNLGGTLGIRSSTIVRNTGVVGGIHNTGSLTLANSIVARNGGFNCVGTFNSLGYNLFQLSPFDDCGPNAASDVHVPSAVVFTEVLEETPRDNGGPTWTHALIERGHAVDTGYCPGVSADQRGFPRPYDDTRMPNALDGCDIGAFEWQPEPPPPSGPGRGPKK